MATSTATRSARPLPSLTPVRRCLELNYSGS